MFKLIIAVGVLLVLAILLTIFRVHTLVNVVRGTEKKYVSGSNKVNAVLFVLFLIVSMVALFWYSYANFDRYQLPVASDHGIEIDSMFWITTGVTLVAFLITQVLLFGFAFFYQHKEKSSAYYYPDNPTIELVWTLIPAIVLAALVFNGWKVWSEVTDKAPSNAEVVEIMGYQFAWKTRYPGKDGKLGTYDYRLIDPVNSFGIDFTDKNSFDDFTPREIHIPKGQPVLFKIRARDVLHSVFAPHFRLKMDAVPGMPTRFWFVPTKSTQDMRDELNDPEFDYEIACTEVCGRGHFSMKIKLVVDEPADYAKWKAEQKSFLSKNPEFLSEVPAELKEVALISAGANEESAN